MLIRGALLPDGRDASVRVCAGRVDEIGSLTAQPGEVVHDLPGHVLLPAFVEPHAHLDKAFLAERIDNPTGDLLGAITAMEANRHLITVPDIADRAERAIRLLATNGTTLIRSHADTTVESRLGPIEGLGLARARTAHLADVQIVALLGWPVSGSGEATTRALARDAVAAGADVIGGCPHLDEDPAAATAVLLDIAAELGVPIDLHTDETLSPDARSLRTLADLVIRTGFPHGVAASHCVSLGVHDEREQMATAELVAAAGISVIALPHTNLYLQGRDRPCGTPRGLTAVGALRSAGATVAAGGDNLQDPFNLVGRGDPLETAALMVMAAHLLPADAVHAVTDAARRAVAAPAVGPWPGAPADLVAVPGASTREAVAFQPPGRLVLRGGTVIDASS